MYMAGRAILAGIGDETPQISGHQLVDTSQLVDCGAPPDWDGLSGTPGSEAIGCTCGVAGMQSGSGGMHAAGLSHVPYH